jgi:hypothetical protein
MADTDRNHEDEDDENIDDDVLQGLAIVEGRITEDTRKGYERKIRLFKMWCIEKHGDRVDELFENARDQESIQLKKPIPNEIVIGYLGYYMKARKKKGGRRGKENEQQAEPELPEELGIEVLGDDKLKTVSTVQGFLSAFKYLHDEQEPVMEIPVETKKNLAKFMAGYKRKIASKKENGEMKSQEGKDAFKMESYTYICKCLLVLMPAMLAMSLHLFCILCWNLMARSISVSKLRYDHTTWEADALVIKLNKMKNDQEGNNVQDRRVYANPMNPAICAILSLGILIVCRKYEDGKIFPDDCMDTKFGKWMRTLLSKLTPA